LSRSRLGGCAQDGFGVGCSQGERVMHNTKRADRIAQLEDTLRQLKAREQAVEARRRVLESRRKRKDDTRRKILVGAIVLAKVDQGVIDSNQLRRWLDQALTRVDDRGLFQLDPAVPQAGIGAVGSDAR
jgi:hypothetical protein